MTDRVPAVGPIPGGTFGERLTAALRRAGLRNAAVAEAAGVHLKTVSYWRSDAQEPRDTELSAVVGLLRRHGVSTTIPELRYGGRQAPGMVAEASSGSYGVQEERVFLARFQLAMTEAGAGEDEIRSALALAQVPEAERFMATCHDDATPNDRTAAMAWLSRWILTEVRRRHGTTPHVEDEAAPSHPGRRPVATAAKRRGAGGS